MGLFNKKERYSVNELVDENLIKNVVNKLEEISKYNEDIKKGMDESVMEITLNSSIYKNNLETEIKYIKFINDYKDHTVLTIGKYGVHYFDGSSIRRLFIYDGWEAFLNL